MSEATPTTTPAADSEAPAPAEAVSQELGDGGLKALQAERDARKAADKAAADWQSKFNEADAARSTLSEQLEAATAAKPAAVADELRKHLVAFHSIDEEDADLFLTGTDAETLLKQVSRLTARSAAPATPMPDPSQGPKDVQALALNGDPLLADLKSKLGIN